MEKKVRSSFRFSFTEAAARGKAKTNSLSPGLSWSLTLEKTPGKKGDSRVKKTVPD